MKVKRVVGSGVEKLTSADSFTRSTQSSKILLKHGKTKVQLSIKNGIEDRYVRCDHDDKTYLVGELVANNSVPVEYSTAPATPAPSKTTAKLQV